MKSIQRRQFIASSLGAATLGSASVRTVSASPGDRIGVAVIGVNGMGHGHLGNLTKRSDIRIVSLCDIDQRVLDRGVETVAKSRHEKPKLVGDFREVLQDSAVDAVVIATPHHWHCPIAIPALQAGKDIYVEKPASHVFQEGRALVESARRHNRVVQHGTQMRSTEVTFLAAEVLESGILGEIKMTKAWNVQRGKGMKPQPDAPVPAGVDYDRWLGPAAKRPFNPNRFHRTWRLYRDYGNGDMGDDGAHDLDMARWALGVTTHPVRITAHGSTVDLQGEREYPDNMMLAFQYAEGKVLIYEDRLWTPYGLHGFDNGNAFYGTEGHMIFSRRGYFQVFLGRKGEKGPGRSGREIRQNAAANLAHFLECVRSRKETNASAEVAHLTCGLIHLGEIAFRLKRVMEFDPDREIFPKDPEGNKLLTKQYRAPWSLA